MDNPPQQRDGLALLQCERPEVMQAYLRLLGRLGESLEPKVKQLVLIALQVTQGSSRALRRHVPRALETGASRQEVLDAIVLALPVAGLTRTTEALASVADLLTPSGSPSQVHAQPYVENHV